MQKLIFTLILRLGLLGAVLSAGFLLALGKLPGKNQLAEFVFSDKVDVDVREIKLSEIQAVAKLITAEQDYEVNIPLRSDREVLGTVVGSTKLIYIARGTVSAGVDLSKVTIKDIENTPEGLVLNLPAPKILETELDVFKSAVFGESKSVFGPDVLDKLVVQGQQEGKIAIMEQACNSNLLLEAAQNAEKSLAAIIKVNIPNGDCWQAEQTKMS
jgi:hypothetical protein